MRTIDLEELRGRVMAVALVYGCEAGVQEADTAPVGNVVIKIVIVRRSPTGELLTHEDNLVLAHDLDIVVAVVQAVSSAAYRLEQR